MSVADKLGMGPKREVVDNGNGTWTIKVTPPAWTGIEPRAAGIILSTGQYERYEQWLSGALIQDALFDLSPAQREYLLTGM